MAHRGVVVELVIGILICMVLVWDSEAQPWSIWAIGIGALTVAGSYWISRDCWHAFLHGLTSAFMVSVLGVVTRLSPGWYDSVLDSIL